MCNNNILNKATSHVSPSFLPLCNPYDFLNFADDTLFLVATLNTIEAEPPSVTY